MNKPWYIDFARAKTKAPVYAFYFYFWSAENFKNACDLDELASEPTIVMWLWSADALFWQLLIDHNMDVYYKVKHSLRSMAVLLSRAEERRSREIRARSARERAAKPREK